ncbi:MAG: hypothetical protein QM535_18595 [Limnohabitans sp.]|nr:hypothetical protein [Limnohabitans sp.]
MELQEIIKNTFEIFNYSTPLEITNVCKVCCMCKDNTSKLISLPLREIPIDLITEYNDGAQALNFDMSEFKYFLPRYLELISEFKFTSAIDIALSLKNLNFDKDLFWNNSEEIKCINDFTEVFFKKCLETDKFWNEGSLLDIICMFYNSGIDIYKLLNLWLIELRNFSIIHLEQLINNNFSKRWKMRKFGFGDAYFYQTIENWVIKNKQIILEAIERHIFEPTLEEEQLQKLSYLYDVIKYL